MWSDSPYTQNNCDEQFAFIQIGCALYHQWIKPNYHCAKHNQGASNVYALIAATNDISNGITDSYDVITLENEDGELTLNGETQESLTSEQGKFTRVLLMCVLSLKLPESSSCIQSVNSQSVQISDALFRKCFILIPILIQGCLKKHEYTPSPWRSHCYHRSALGASCPNQIFLWDEKT